MNIAIYDLHNLRLELQVMLGDKNVEEAGRIVRKDKLEDIFIDKQGYVIGLSKPI